MGIAIIATRYYEDRKHEEIDTASDPDSSRHMGGRADNIHNIDDYNVAVDAIGHVNFAFDHAIIVAERNIGYDSKLDLQRRDHYSEQHGDDPEFTGDAEHHYAEQHDYAFDQPSVKP